MLAGNRVEDEVCNTSGGDSSDISSDSRPKRNSHTRKAVKDTRTSEKALLGMGSNGTKLAEINFSTDEDKIHVVNVTVQHEILNSLNGRPSQHIKNQIQLGDYCLPPDKKEETLGGIASSQTTEYADPYETKQLMEAFKKTKGPRRSAPCDTDIYELAKPTDIDPTDGASSKSNKLSFRHTYAEGNTPFVLSKSGTSVDSGVEDPDEYDHTTTWVTNNNNKLRMAQVIPSPIQTENHVIPNQRDQRSPKGLPVQHSSNEVPTGESVYTGSYEDPWDSANSKQKFDITINKAKKEYRKKSQSDDYEEPILNPTQSLRTASATYEEAWDLKAREEQLENTVQEAHRRMSEGQQNMRRPRDRSHREPISLPKTPENCSQNSKSEKFIYSEPYEEPWDVKQREKEKVLQERFSKAASQGTKSPHKEDFDMPNFHAPPPPKHEENHGWTSPSSRSPHQSGSPNQRRQSEGTRNAMSVAEKINPDMPLDIQKFYHGKIGRKQAENLLLIHKEGSYLVRRSETQDNVFSLTLKGVGGIPMHLRISLASGMYILGENSKPFPTVPEMIDHYTQHELPVLKADRIKLLHPIPRQ